MGKHSSFDVEKVIDEAADVAFRRIIQRKIGEVLEDHERFMELGQAGRNTPDECAIMEKRNG